MSYQLYPLLLHSESCIWWWHTQTRMKMRELTLREKKAIWMLKEKRKSIRALAKTKGMEQSRVWKPSATPATNNDLICWENNNSWWQTNKKLWKWTLKDVSVKSPTTSKKAGCPQETLTQNYRCYTARCKPLTSTKIRKARLEFAKRHKGEQEGFWNCVYGPMRQRWTFI